MLPYARGEARVASPEPMAVDDLLCSCVIVGILNSCFGRLVRMESKSGKREKEVLYHDA